MYKQIEKYENFSNTFIFLHKYRTKAHGLTSRADIGGITRQDELP